MSDLTASPPTLQVRKCVRHEMREAAARCPNCRDFFCRECVIEHNGKLLCTGCLLKLSGQSRRSSRQGAWLIRGGQLFAAALLLAAMFYGLGFILLKIPPAFHDGTIWKKSLLK